MTCENGRFSTTEAEILQYYPPIGDLQPLLYGYLQQMLLSGAYSLDARDVDEVATKLSDGVDISRPSHASVWLSILSEAERDYPHLSFWRGDSEVYMESAESGQFCLGDAGYSMEWSKVHGSSLLGRFSIARLHELYGLGLIWISQTGHISSGIGWHIGTEHAGEPIGQYMEIYEFSG